MKCLYYVAPTLKSTLDISDDLHAVGINDYFGHVVSRDESGRKQHHIHSSNYLETLDLIRDGLIGAVLGFLAGLLGVWALQYFDPLGPKIHVPMLVNYAIVVVVTLFGAWEGGLIGIAAENKKIARFHDDLEAGKYLILIYVLMIKEPAVRAMMSERHPEAELAAVDRHFINPFSGLKRGAEGDRPSPRAQSKV
jgi:hypothetical protein